MSNKSFSKIKNKKLNSFISFVRGRLALPFKWSFFEHAGVENVEMVLDSAFE